MNVSSADGHNFYPTPEFGKLLTTAKRLRRDVIRLRRVGTDTISYNSLLKNIDALEESLKVHFEEIFTLERAFTATASTRLTKKQRRMLRWLLEKYRDEVVYTTLIDRLSEDLSIPKSTVRWNLRGLRDAGLIIAGDKENKGIPAGLTGMGKIVADYIVTVQFDEDNRKHI